MAQTLQCRRRIIKISECRKTLSERPVSADPEAVRQALEAGPHTNTRRLSASWPLRIPPCIGKLSNSGMAKSAVPHELIQERARNQVDVSHQLLDQRFCDRKIKPIFTNDQKWIFSRNLDYRNQWLNPGKFPELVVRHGRFEHKMMLCVYWNFEDLINFELVKDGCAINAILYSQQLDRSDLKEFGCGQSKTDPPRAG